MTTKFALAAILTMAATVTAQTPDERVRLAQERLAAKQRAAATQPAAVENRDLQVEVTRLRAENAKLRAEVAALRAEVAALPPPLFRSKPEETPAPAADAPAVAPTTLPASAFPTEVVKDNPSTPEAKRKKFRSYYDPIKIGHTSKYEIDGLMSKWEDWYGTKVRRSEFETGTDWKRYVYYFGNRFGGSTMTIVVKDGVVADKSCTE